MIKTICNFEKKQIFGGDYGMNFSAFEKGVNVTFHNDTVAVKFDKSTVRFHDWFYEPNIKCTVNQVGSKNHPERNDQLLLGACYDKQGKIISNNINSWVYKEQVDIIK